MYYHTMIVFADDLSFKMNTMEGDYIFHFIVPHSMLNDVVHQYRVIYSNK
jgi:hypothetical protein